jgi:hypothetical protein
MTAVLSHLCSSPSKDESHTSPASWSSKKARGVLSANMEPDRGVPLYCRMADSAVPNERSLASAPRRGREVAAAPAPAAGALSRRAVALAPPRPCPGADADAREGSEAERGRRAGRMRPRSSEERVSTVGPPGHGLTYRPRRSVEPETVGPSSNDIRGECTCSSVCPIICGSVTR